MMKATAMLLRTSNFMNRKIPSTFKFSYQYVNSMAHQRTRLTLINVIIYNEA